MKEFIFPFIGFLSSSFSFQPLPHRHSFIPSFLLGPSIFSNTHTHFLSTLAHSMLFQSILAPFFSVFLRRSCEVGVVIEDHYWFTQ